MKRARFLLPLAVMALAPSTASANAGTPLMWASMLHLVFGNAIIGLIEGLLLSWLFGCPKRKSILILIGANYASAWAGGFLVAGALAAIPDITIQNLRFWFLILTAAAFFVTLLIEIPFFWYALRSHERPLRQALKATPTVHAISYLLLFGWYWMASGTSMMTQVRVVSSDSMAQGDGYFLYYLSAEGDQVLQLRLGSKGESKVVSEVFAPHDNDRLFARANVDAGFNLFVRLDSAERGSGQEVLIKESFSLHAPVEWRIAEGHSVEAQGTWFNFGPVPSLAEDSNWEFRTGFWPVEGISGRNEERSGSFHLSLETPFAAWSIRNATHLQGDYLVFQLGDDQICMLHPETMRIALIARGKGPIVAGSKLPHE